MGNPAEETYRYPNQSLIYDVELKLPSPAVNRLSLRSVNSALSFAQFLFATLTKIEPDFQANISRSAFHWIGRLHPPA